MPLMNDPDLPRDSGCSDQGLAACIVYGSRTFFRWIVCRAVNLSLEHGNSDGSCVAYVWFGVDSWAALRQLQGWISIRSARLRTGRKTRLEAFPGQNLYVVWAIRHAMDETCPSRSRVRCSRAFDAANKIGDLTFAAYSCEHLTTNLSRDRRSAR